MAKEICKHCGATLDGKVERELPDGAKYGRCFRCQRPYVIAVGKAAKAPKSEPEPETKPVKE